MWTLNVVDELECAPPHLPSTIVLKIVKKHLSSYHRKTDGKRNKDDDEAVISIKSSLRYNYIM